MIANEDEEAVGANTTNISCSGEIVLEGRKDLGCDAAVSTNKAASSSLGLAEKFSSDPSENTAATSSDSLADDDKIVSNLILRDAVDDDDDDDSLIRRAEVMIEEERVRSAARLLRNIQEPSRLNDNHLHILESEQACIKAIAELTSSLDGTWKKQGENHGDWNTAIYYKLDSENRLTCRIETPLEQSLLVPLLSVLNESDLYRSWMPYFKRPFLMGVSHTEKLARLGRGRQIIRVDADMPWPFEKRQALLDAAAFDDIDESGCIVVSISSLKEGDHDNILGPIGPAPKGFDRIDFDGNILVRPCPEDHAMLESLQETPLLVGYSMRVDAHVTAMPLMLINFVTRTVIGRIWNSLLHVADQVRSGDRPQHAQMIEDNRILYDWIESRVQVMLERMNAAHKKN